MYVRIQTSAVDKCVEVATPPEAVGRCGLIRFEVTGQISFWLPGAVGAKKFNILLSKF
jgi:hypothetical protein